MGKIVFVLAFVLTLFVPTFQVKPEAIDWKCKAQDRMDLMLWEQQQERIRKEKELARYTDFHRDYGILHNYSVDMDKYLSVMAHKESRDDYKALNRFGYMGKYQFGKTTLKHLRGNGLLTFENTEIKTQKFLDNPVLQEAAMSALTAHNLQCLKSYGLMKFLGKDVGGVKITIEGLLAAAHLRGPWAVRQFVVTGGDINKVDGNGTSVKTYIKAFV